MKIYIIGLMGGKTDLGWPQFDESKRKLLNQGHEVISPADIDKERGVTPQWFSGLSKEESDEFLHKTILLDLELIKSCDAVYHMKGWRESMGFCFVEHWYARRLKKFRIYEDEKENEEFYELEDRLRGKTKKNGENT